MGISFGLEVAKRKVNFVEGQDARENVDMLNHRYLETQHDFFVMLQ